MHISGPLSFAVQLPHPSLTAAILLAGGVAYRFLPVRPFPRWNSQQLIVHAEVAGRESRNSGVSRSARLSNGSSGGSPA